MESYVRKHPDKLEYVMKRYPKNDPRLSTLKYKMDKMTEVVISILKHNFQLTKICLRKVKERTKKNMNLTDPKNFKPVKDPIKYVDVNKKKKLKETVTRHFNKQLRNKSIFGLNISKGKKEKTKDDRERENKSKR